MVNEYQTKRFCKDDISLIENYDKAIADKTQTWHCHHRRETIYSRSGLIEIGEYYNRPACELIFLTPNEHHKLHKIGENNPNFGKPAWNNGKHHSEETRKKMSEANKGENNPMFGKHHSEETRKKMSEALKSKPTCIKGTHWYNNGVKSIQAKTCPEGFVKGRLPGLNVGRKLSEESRMKISRNNKGHTPWNKGKRKCQV